MPHKRSSESFQQLIGQCVSIFGIIIELSTLYRKIKKYVKLQVGKGRRDGLKQVSKRSNES